MLHVVLVASHAERQFASLFGRMLAESRRCKGCFSVHILGWQQPFAGTYVKDDLVLAFAQTLPPSALILHLDAFDTLPVSFSHRDRRALMRGLGDAGLLVSTDLLSRAGVWAWYYSRVFGGDLKVNTGLFIGRAGFIASFLSRPDCQRWRTLSSNQMAWVRCLKQNASGVVLDSEARFFLNLQGDPGSIVYERELDFRGDRAWFRGQRPLFISAPGHKKLHRVQCRLGMLPGGPSSAKARAAHCEARFPLEEMAATASLQTSWKDPHPLLTWRCTLLHKHTQIHAHALVLTPIAIRGAQGDERQATRACARAVPSVFANACARSAPYSSSAWSGFSAGGPVAWVVVESTCTRAAIVRRIVSALQQAADGEELSGRTVAGAQRLRAWSTVRNLSAVQRDARDETILTSRLLNTSRDYTNQPLTIHLTCNR